MDPVNVPAKFEVRSFTRVWDNSEFWVGVGTPILGKMRPYGVGDGTIRKNAGEFL